MEFIKSVRFISGVFYFLQLAGDFFPLLLSSSPVFVVALINQFIAKEQNHFFVLFCIQSNNNEGKNSVIRLC